MMAVEHQVVVEQVHKQVRQPVMLVVVHSVLEPEMLLRC